MDALFANAWGDDADTTHITPLPSFQRSLSPPPDLDPTTDVKEEAPADDSGWGGHDDAEQSITWHVPASPLAAPALDDTPEPTWSRDEDIPASPVAAAEEEEDDVFPVPLKLDTPPSVKEVEMEDDFGEFGEMHLDATREDVMPSWTSGEEWRPATVPEKVVEEESGGWGSSWKRDESRDERADVGGQDEIADEDAWSRVPRSVEVSQLPAELIASIQERCRQFSDAAFALDTAGVFQPASGVGLALSSLLDSDGELHTLSFLRADLDAHLSRLSLADTAVDRLFRSALDATASRSSEILKGAASKRAGRSQWALGGASGDIWRNGDDAASPNGSDHLGFPSLPSERLDLDRFDTTVPSASAPATKASFFSMFNRKTEAVTNTPASMLVRKSMDAAVPVKVEPEPRLRSASPAPRAASIDIGTPPLPPTQPIKSRWSMASTPAVATTSALPPTQAALTDVPAGQSAVSRFLGRFGQGTQHRPMSQSGDGWQANGRGSYSDSMDLFEDHAYDGPNSTSISSPPSQLQNTGVFADFMSDAGPIKAEAKSEDAYFDLLTSSPSVQRTAPVSTLEGPKAMRSAQAATPVRASTPLTTTIRPQAPSQPLAGFSFPPPPPSQPLSRSRGPDLLDMDDDPPLLAAPTVTSRTATPQPPVPKPAPPSSVTQGKGGLSAQDLSFFDSL